MGDRVALRHLRYFVAVAEERSFRQAAERLHLSQPPLSRQIADLEHELGTRLLERDRTGVRLTPAGDEALLRARAMLALWDATIADLRRAAARERFRVGVTFAIAPTELRRLATALQAVAGPVVPEFIPQGSDPAARDIRDGRLEAALVALPADIGALHCLPLRRVRLAIALPAGHPAARRREVALRDVQDLPLYWFPRRASPRYHDHCRAVFRDAGYAPRINADMPRSLQVFNDIALGNRCTIGPETAAIPRIEGLAVRRLREGDALALQLALVHDPARAGALTRALARLAVREFGAKVPRRRR
jgi:DNA-binding transcriptional LysR family regulator